ncbi:hypothetical protein AUR04nite_30430 [Glutamicibacter uratoxydans]|uniref:DUF402 domain-containing protein n=1 Tax=Glutamicibacter uratoxydans TaxID=43667 RepID=A0A4Y4DYQ9_GLUUR|nr:DUF402 domain-containing protein [Glutamicibacter uratoxydans]GED07511.1 hypothetical protein AUR04nite_30430 [Glutamicibacter uratoxydans]
MSAQLGCPAGLPREPENPQFGALVVARAWKYNGAAHWVVPGFYLGQDQYGHWIHQPAGSLIARPSTAHLAPCDALCLIPHEGQWVATLYNDPVEDFDVYIDLASSIGWQQMKRGAWEVNSIDLDLDVIRSHSRGTFLEDEDEFREHSHSMNYPSDLIEQVSAESLALLAQVEADREPFSHAHRELWLAKAREL